MQVLKKKFSRAEFLVGIILNDGRQSLSGQTGHCLSPGPLPHNISGFLMVPQRLEEACGDSGPERGRNVPKITQQMSGRAGARTIIPVPTFLTLMLGTA